MVFSVRANSDETTATLFNIMLLNGFCNNSNIQGINPFEIEKEGLTAFDRLLSYINSIGKQFDLKGDANILIELQESMKISVAEDNNEGIRIVASTFLKQVDFFHKEVNGKNI